VELADNVKEESVEFLSGISLKLMNCGTQGSGFAINKTEVGTTLFSKSGPS